MQITKMIKKREEGQGLVEYALLLVLVAVVVIIILMLLGTQVVFTFARVIGGLNGDTIDDGAVFLAADQSVSGSAICTVTLTDIRFVAVDDGEPVTNESVTATILVNGVSGPSVTGTASNVGIVTAAGPVTASGSCPVKITMSYDD